MKFDLKMSVSSFVITLTKGLHGLILVGLILVFVFLSIFPALLVKLGLTQSNDGAAEMRSAFLIMPLVLIAEYVWFLSTASDRQHNFLISAVLLATAAIPFINLIKGSFL